jgi:hypothetical protein
VRNRTGERGAGKRRKAYELLVSKSSQPCRTGRILGAVESFCVRLETVEENATRGKRREIGAGLKAPASAKLRTDPVSANFTDEEKS